MSERFINDGIYGDGDLYQSDFGVPGRYLANFECSDHYFSTRVNYTAALTPGGTEAFRIHNVVMRIAPDRQGRFGYDAFADMVRFTERVSVVVNHSGSEFILSHIQLIAQRKRHQPVG